MSNKIPTVSSEIVSKTVRNDQDGFYARIPLDQPVTKGWTLAWYNLLCTEIHTVPLGDEQMHVADKRCKCNPTRDIHSVFHFVHHAYDTREKFERQGITNTGADGWTNIGAVGEYRHYPEDKE